MKQETFTDREYSFRKKKTKREEFPEIMDGIIPWDEWVGAIEPYCPKGKRGRPPMGIEKTLGMYLLQIWFSLSDPATKLRYLIENAFLRLKRRRGIAARCARNTASFIAAVQIRRIVLWATGLT